METISTFTLEAVISRKEMIELIEQNPSKLSDLVLISISEPIFENYEDEALTDEQVKPFKASIRAKFWDIEEQIGNYEPISDETALQLQQFIQQHITERFIIHCRAGVSRSAAVGKAIECIKYFGIGEEAKYNYQTSFNSEIDSHSRYFPNYTVFNKLTKDYSWFTQKTK